MDLFWKNFRFLILSFQKNLSAYFLAIFVKNYEKLSLAKASWCWQESMKHPLSY